MTVQAFFEALYANKLLVATIATIILGLNVLRIRYQPGLRRIPGPFLASITSLHRCLTGIQGQQFLKDIEYHRKYGPLVRVGPYHVSVSDSSCINQIYGISSKFYKSEFYDIFHADTGTSKVPTMFSVRDESLHKSMKRPVANAYSMTSMVELEPMADECSRIFMSKMDRMEGEDVDLGTWLQWYAFDFVTSVTFSERLGFMEQETDVAQIIDAIEGRLAYNAIIGQAPYLHKFLLGNSFVKTITSSLKAVARLNSARKIVVFAAKQLEKYSNTEKSLTSPKDMLARFKRSREGEVLITDKQVLAHVSANIFAGSDTTAIALRAIIYFLCKNPTCYQDAVAELDKFDRDGELSDPVKFTEAMRMPYLQACIKEAMRLHPSGGQMLERVVPEGGSTLSGVYLQEGTIVGMNPWVTSRDEVVYGLDVDEFRPDRWLTAEPAKLQAMERNFLAFGAGSRTCIGKNVSLLEISKLIPQLLRRYDIHLSRPDAELTLTGFFFVKQTGLYCRLTRRKNSS